MDRWKRAYTHLGFESLDHGRERFIVYGPPQHSGSTWQRGSSPGTGSFPGIDGPLEWLALALLAAPGTARAAFLIALGPNRRGEWSRGLEEPGT